MQQYLPAGGFMTWNRLGKPVACINGKHLTSRETFRLLDRKIREKMKIDATALRFAMEFEAAKQEN